MRTWLTLMSENARWLILIVASLILKAQQVVALAAPEEQRRWKAE